MPPTPYIPGLADFAIPPFSFTTVTSATFILDADPNKLQQVCDTFLNVPLNRTGAIKFVPAGSQRVFMCCSTFPVAEAPAMPLGFSAYTEITLLFSVLDPQINQFSWYVPVLYLDGPPANIEEWQAELPIAAGRELYGLPKARGDINLDWTYRTGTVDQIDPKTSGLKVDLADSITISLGVCATPTVFDEIAALETDVLDLVIAEYHARIKMRPPEEILELQRRIGVIRREIAALNERRDEVVAARNAAMLDLTRLRDNPEDRHILTPDELIEMFWGGDPYEILNLEHPPGGREAWLASLGFVKRKKPPKKKKKKGRKTQMLLSGPIAPAGDYELHFPLLGLRQLPDPRPANLGQASYQEVVRTSLRFLDSPYKPVQVYCVEIKDSPMARLLGIGPTKQTITEVNNYAYSGVQAIFGEGAQIIPRIP